MNKKQILLWSSGGLDYTNLVQIVITTIKPLVFQSVKTLSRLFDGYDGSDKSD
jgi:hypothetical protein